MKMLTCFFFADAEVTSNESVDMELSSSQREQLQSTLRDNHEENSSNIQAVRHEHPNMELSSSQRTITKYIEG